MISSRINTHSCNSISSNTALSATDGSPDQPSNTNASLEEEPMLRIGHGYDIHRLIEGTPLVIGGVTIPFRLGIPYH